MKSRWWVVGLLFLASAFARAGEPNGRTPFWRHWLTQRVCPTAGGCPDDYDRKPCPPIIGVSRCGGPDDYCRKPAPFVQGVPRCGGPDDHCRKPLPCLLCPPLAEYLRCGPPSCVVELP